MKLTNKIMEDTIFKIFVFCMFIVLGVLILGILKWLFKYTKLFHQHHLWGVRVLIIFPIIVLIIIPIIIVEYLFRKDHPELLIAIMVGCVGSYYIFKELENN